MMKNRIITIGIGAAILFSLCTSCFSMAASAETITANTAPYLSEFFELPLTEIESNLNVSHTTANSNQIVVSVSNAQLKKLIGELEPQRDEIGKDAELFRIAFFDLLLDKLHLSGIYDAVVSEYLSTDMPSAWWDPMHPFDVEDCSDGSYACISLQYPENTQNPEDHLEEYTLQNGDTNVTVDRYELTQRSLYVILTYGDRAYFSDAYEEPITLSTTTAETTTAETTTAEAEKITDIDQICTILTAYFEENGLDAVCFYAETYDLHPEYAGKVIVEYNYVDYIGMNYQIDRDHLMEYLIEQNIPKESIRVVTLLNGERYVPETASDTKVNENVLDAFASGAQSVEVYILYMDIPVGEISVWAKEQAAIYAETLDKNVYSEEEIVNMEFDYCAEIAVEALKKERNARTTEILTAIGVDPASATCDENYPRLSCVLTKDQVEAAKGNELVRRITLKSEWKSAEDLGITTEIAEVSDSTTTTTTAVTMKITDIEQIRSMLIAFVEENGLDARIVSDKEYPGYRPIVVEYNLDAEMNAWAVLRDYIEEQNIDKHPINVVPIVDGIPITTATADVENTTTTTTTTTTDGTNTDLPQTGNNSVTNILISLAALLLTAAGAGIVYSSRILRRKKQDL